MSAVILSRSKHHSLVPVNTGVSKRTRPSHRRADRERSAAPMIHESPVAQSFIVSEKECRNDMLLEETYGPFDNLIAANNKVDRIYRERGGEIESDCWTRGQLLDGRLVCYRSDKSCPIRIEVTLAAGGIHLPYVSNSRQNLEKLIGNQNTLQALNGKIVRDGLPLLIDRLLKDPANTDKLIAAVVTAEDGPERAMRCLLASESTGTHFATLLNELKADVMNTLQEQWRNDYVTANCPDWRHEYESDNKAAWLEDSTSSWVNEEELRLQMHEQELRLELSEVRSTAQATTSAMPSLEAFPQARSSQEHLFQQFDRRYEDEKSRSQQGTAKAVIGSRP